MWGLNVLIHDHRLSVYFGFIKIVRQRKRNFVVVEHRVVVLVFQYFGSYAA